MDDEPEEPKDPILPVLDEHDIAAVVGLLIRLMRTDYANQRDREKIEELQAAVAKRSGLRPKYVAAVGAFGFDTAASGVWDNVRAAIGHEAYSRAWVIATTSSLIKAGEAPQEGNSEGAQIKDHSSDGSGDEPRNEAAHVSPKISEAILAYLRSIQSRGAHVGEIKRHLFDTYGIETHEKTPGMTLYRLSKEGVVRRDGRLWFAVNAAGSAEIEEFETENSNKENGD